MSSQRPDKEVHLRSLEEILVSSFSEQGQTTLLPTTLVCGIFENERPLRKSAGEIDWRLRGFLSRYLRDGRITGQKNEITYIPVVFNNKTKHLFIVGIGTPDRGSKNECLETLEIIGLKLNKLGIKNLAISSSSFPYAQKVDLEKSFSTFQLEVAK